MVEDARKAPDGEARECQRNPEAGLAVRNAISWRSTPPPLLLLILPYGTIDGRRLLPIFHSRHVLENYHESAYRRTENTGSSAKM